MKSNNDLFEATRKKLSDAAAHMLGIPKFEYTFGISIYSDRANVYAHQSKNSNDRFSKIIPIPRTRTHQLFWEANRFRTIPIEDYSVSVWISPYAMGQYVTYDFPFQIKSIWSFPALRISIDGKFAESILHEIKTIHFDAVENGCLLLEIDADTYETLPISEQEQIILKDLLSIAKMIQNESAVRSSSGHIWLKSKGFISLEYGSYDLQNLNPLGLLKLPEVLCSDMEKASMVYVNDRWKRRRPRKASR